MTAKTPLLELARLFGRLGLTAFGGPAAHIAMLHTEVVERRRWLADSEFLDLLGATNLIPGPNSTEMVLHIGFRQAGWAGLLVAGACFIGPAFLLVLLCAWLYTRYGTLPQAQALLDGLTPVVIAIIAVALIKLGRTALRSWLTWALALAVIGGALLGVNAVLLLLLSGCATLLAFQGWSRARALLLLLPATAAGDPERSWSLGGLFMVFLKIGAVLYGSGYVLLAFLRADLVDRLGWLTDQQLLDAIAVGQFTPGPVFTTATFIGYIIGAPHGLGLLAASVATIGIFAPAFALVGVTQPLLGRLVQIAWLRAVLDGVNAASLGLMAAVLAQLTWTTLERSLLPLWMICSLAAAAFVLLQVKKVNATWLLLGGAVLGMLWAG